MQGWFRVRDKERLTKQSNLGYLTRTIDIMIASEWSEAASSGGMQQMCPGTVVRSLTQHGVRDEAVRDIQSPRWVCRSWGKALRAGCGRSEGDNQWHLGLRSTSLAMTPE